MTKIALFYNFYPHYRKGIIKKLNDELDIDFYGSTKGLDGVKVLQLDGNYSFYQTTNYYFGKYLIQSKVITSSIFGKYDTYIFLANPYYISTWIGAIICRLRNKRVVFWGHGFLSSKRNIKNRIRILYFRLCDCFYTYGWGAKFNAVSFGFNESNIYVGYNSLDYESQLIYRNRLDHQVDKKFKKDRFDLKIICISRLTAICKYDLLFQAIHEIQTISDHKPMVNIIGNGPQLDYLKNLASTLDINVNFLGAIYDEKIISEIIYSSDVTVSPGKVGLTAMHSLMYGTPVISHDDMPSQMPEVEAIRHGVTGLLFKKDDISSLAYYLLNYFDYFPNREKTRRDCQLIIDRLYNPRKQFEVMRDAIDGSPPSMDIELKIFE